jgi:hypothetical protein
MDLADIARQHQLTFPGATAAQTASFISHCLEAVTRPCKVYAQDAMPMSLQGNTAMPATKRTSRDQLWQRRNDDTDGVKPNEFIDGGGGYNGPTLVTAPHDFVDTSGDQDPDDDNGGVSPETACNFIRLMANRYAQDGVGEGSAHSEFISGLADILKEEHDNANGMDRMRRRGGRDTDPSPLVGNFRGSTGDQQLSSWRGGNRGALPSSDRRRAGHDRALVRSINESGFAQRWGGLTRNVKLGGY